MIDLLLLALSRTFGSGGARGFTAPLPPPRSRAWAIAAVSAAIVVLAIYLLRLDGVAGLVVDDAWYVLFARSLARGEGYSLVNSPVPGILPPNPPGFAALLSLIFLISPSFPQNLWLLKSVSIAAMIGVAVLTCRYLASRQMPSALAFLMSLAIALTPAFVFLATSTVMSECVFTLVQLLTVVSLDRSARDGGRPRHAAAAGVLAAVTVLIRTAGIPLPAAGVLFLAWRRQWRHALVFAVVVAACLTPWWLYSRTHQPTMAEREAHGGAHAFTYGHEFWMRWAGVPASGTITVRDLPARAWGGVVDVFGRDVGGIVVPSLYRGPSESGEEVISLGGGPYPASMGSARGTMAVSLALSCLALGGFVAAVRRGPTAAEFVVPLSVGLIVLWPQWAYRFVLPMTPFLFFYLITGIRALLPSAARVVLLCVIGLHLADHVQYIAASRTQTLDWAADADEIDAVLRWLNEHAGDGDVATTNAALVHLRTGRRTIALDDPDENWDRWKKLGVRYLVCLRPAALPPERRPHTLLYRSPGRGYWIVEI